MKSASPAKNLSQFLAVVSISLAAVSAASAQTAVTDPVGYLNITCSGSSDTIVALPFTRPPEFVGAVASTGSNTVTVSGSTGWTNNSLVYSGSGVQPKTYYVLIGANPVSIPGTVTTGSGSSTVTGVGTAFLTGTTPVAVGDGLNITGAGYYTVQAVNSNTSLTITIPALAGVSGAAATVSKSAKEGNSYTVTANDSSTLTLNLNGDNSALSSVQPNTQIILIPYWTLKSVFPASDANVSYTPSTSPLLRKTQIQIPNYSGNGIDLTPSATYYYYNSAWRQAGRNTSEDHSDDVLIPNGYFTVRNSSSPTTTLTVTGNVLMQKLVVPLATSSSGAQDNSVSTIRPVDVTLNSSGLISSGAFTVSTSPLLRKDQLLVFDNTQVSFDKVPAATYYYYNGAWRKAGANVTLDFGTDVIPAGAGVVIRKSTSDGSTRFWSFTPTYSNL